MTPSDEELRDKGDYLAVRSRQDSCSCTDLAKEITRALAFVRNQSFKAGEESGIRKAVGAAREWENFYARMQEKSKPGEKDGLYRQLAAEDIREAILKLLPPQEGAPESSENKK